MNPRTFDVEVLRAVTFPIIDAHQHVWDPARAEYDWLGPELHPVDRAISFDEVASELRAAGIDRTVLVQSADNPEDTALMRDTARAHREVAGIVGYAPLHDPAATARTLDDWADESLMVGVRVLIHNMADSDWLLRPDVDESLGILERRGLSFDLVAVRDRHVELVPILSERHPDLRIVIDHLAKPPIGVEDAHGRWARLMADAAANPLVFAKVSGLYSATADMAAWTTADIRPFVDTAREQFGAARLMYGGDWPISVLAGGYTRVWEGLRPIFDAWDEDDRDDVLGRTAARFYRLDLQREEVSS